MDWFTVILLLSSVLNANCCTGGRRSTKKSPTPTPLPPPAEEIIEAKAVIKQSAVPARGSATGARKPVTDEDLQKLSQQLVNEDVNNVGHLLRPNHQGKALANLRTDKAKFPLFGNIPHEVLKGPTISAMWKLLDNYDPTVTKKETTNAHEEKEINDFLNAVLATQVMNTTETFLQSKGLIKKSLRDTLKEIWFDFYGRGGRTKGSSGFEHVFIGEIKDGKVSGFHNWVTFIHEEQEKDVDYKGFMKYISFGKKGQILKSRFEWLNKNKPVSSMFIGTSPELEMSLYTICFYARPSKECNLKINNKSFAIQTYPYRERGGKILVGSAFPLV